MANTHLTIDMITRKSLQILSNELVLARNIDRQYDPQYGQEGAKIGASCRVRKPARYLVQDGAPMQAEDWSDDYTTVTVSTQKHVAVNFTSAERTLSLDDFSDRVLKPAISQLAASIDADLHNMYKDVYNSVGTPGTTPGTSLVLGQAMQKLDEGAIPRSMRMAIVNPAANVQLVEGMKGLFNPGATVSRQFSSGVMGTGVLGYEEIAMSQSVKVHTTGDWGTTITVTSTISTQGQATVPISFTGSSKTWKQGDVFTIADCYAVNPQTRATTGSLQQFVVTSDTSGSSTATLSVSPAIYTATHKLATVDSFPQSGKTVTMLGTANTATYPQNLIFHRNAFTMVTTDLPAPRSGEWSRANNAGISMRVWSDSDINSDRHPTRIDVLYGYKTLRPEMAVRLWG
jgi:hypothetical protein